MKYEDISKKVKEVDALEKHLEDVNFNNVLECCNQVLKTEFIDREAIMNEYREKIKSKIDKMKVEIENIGGATTMLDIMESQEKFGNRTTIVETKGVYNKPHTNIPDVLFIDEKTR